ncbi:ABC transporter permease [Sediminicoccus sp. KRV36]|uniref:ABC transporter permease n=1 Tax=Sediminicoccus sp. KRV36 TaxID=3133721 RepID=UPI00200DBB83|nr:ABC transporter permease [Sediminicoccus rosea]UPY35624.1 ABC transporter permease [Sediminicoccus rosea]
MTARGAALALLVAIYVACLILAPSGSLAMLEPHVALLSPRLAHPLGTDDLGRDMLAALLQAGRTSLTVATVATGLALLIGVLVGLLAGIVPGWVDEGLMRVGEITASLPALLLAVLLAALFGGSATNLALLLGLTRWPVIARIVRMEVRSLLGREFLRAAWALGASPFQVARRHLLPHLAGPVMAAAGIVFGGAVVAEAALAFVGLGDPAVTSWGQMVAAGFAVLGLGWWMWLWPAAMLVTVSGLVAVAASAGEELR